MFVAKLLHEKRSDIITCSSLTQVHYSPFVFCVCLNRAGPCEIFCPWFEPHRRNHFTTSQQATQLSILPRSVNEYSKVTLRTNTGHTLITANLKVEVFHPV